MPRSADGTTLRASEATWVAPVVMSLAGLDVRAEQHRDLFGVGAAQHDNGFCFRDLGGVVVAGAGREPAAAKLVTAGTAERFDEVRAAAQA